MVLELERDRAPGTSELELGVAAIDRERDGAGAGRLSSDRVQVRTDQVLDRQLLLDDPLAEQPHEQGLLRIGVVRLLAAVELGDEETEHRHETGGGAVHRHANDQRGRTRRRQLLFVGCHLSMNLNFVNPTAAPRGAPIDRGFVESVSSTNPR